MRNFVYGVFCACLMLLAALSVVQAENNKKSLEKLRSKYFETREEGKKEILDNRAEVIKGSIGIVKTWKEDTYKTRIEIACQVVGNLRAIESVDVLSNMITFCSALRLGGSSRRNPKNYPAAMALAQIGKPGSLAALKKLEEELSELERGLWCYVVGQVEGDYAKVIIEARINNVVDEKAKANLKASLPVLEKVQKTGWVK